MSGGAARIGLGIVGAVVGAYVGGPEGAALGYSLGSAAGGLLLPPKGPDSEGPRLGDTKVQTSTYGAPIPIVYDAFQLAGNVIWLEGNKLKETKHKESAGGKGGPSQTQTTYTYSASFAVGLCEGPIFGVRRIWADAVLLYDGGKPASGAPSSVKDYFAQAAQAVISSFNKDVGPGIRIYTGTADQQPDPRIEADRTTTPAYRNLAYIVFEDLQLQKFGNRIPNIRAEIFTAGSTVDIRTLVGANTAGKLISHTAGVWQLPQADNGLFSGVFSGYTYHVTPDGVLRATTSADPYITPDPQTTPLKQVGYLGGTLVIYDQTDIPFFHNGEGVLRHGLTIIAVRDDAHLSDAVNGYFAGAACTLDGNQLWVLLYFPDGTYRFRVYDPSHNLLREFVQTAIQPTNGGAYAPDIPGWKNSFAVESDGQYIWRFYVDIDNSFKLYRVEDAGSLTQLASYPQLQHGAAGEPILLMADYGVAVALGVNYPNLTSIVFTRLPAITGDNVSLDTILSDICARAGLAAADYDTSALTETVRGYAMTRPAALRALIAQLRPAFRFDVAEIGYQLRFIPRGGASIATLSEDDLAAHEVGQQYPALIEHSRALETDLPRQISLRYIDSDMDYEQGVQYATRLTTQAINDQVFDLPVVFSADEAAQAVDSVLAEAWLGRDQYSFTLAMPWAKLTPGDVIDAPLDGGTVRLRIAQIDDGRPGLRKVQALAESAAIYSSAAVGQIGEPPTVVLSVSGPSRLVLLDAPLLRDQDDTPGIYAAAAGYLAGWGGAVLYRSADGGSSYAALDPPLLTEAALGTCTDKLGNADAAVWDRGNTLNVRLLQGELASTTELAVLNGSNTIAIGAAGRWEIAAFRDAVLEADGSYTLSHLLRGLRGTEHAMAQHAIGDTLVWLTTDGSIQSLALSLDAIGLARLYKAVSIGNSLNQANSESFTFSDERQMPLSVVHIGGRRNGSGDLTISWIRRTRVGGEWRDGTDVPLGEASEAYEIDVLNASTVVRTLSVTSASATYTAAQQSADFGSAQSSIAVKIYQISANVGRGHVAEATL